MGRELILLSVSLVLLASGGLDYIRADEGASGEGESSYSSSG